MVVDGCASEDSFTAGESEVKDLYNDAEQFHYEDAAYKEQEDFVSCNDRAVSHSRTEGE